MGKQQSAFENSPDVPDPAHAQSDPIHVDPDQQSPWEATGVGVPPYSGSHHKNLRESFFHQQLFGEKLTPAVDTSRLRFFIKLIPPAVILIVLIFALAGGGNIFTAILAGKTTHTQQLFVNQPAHIVVHNARGQVRIHGGSDGKVIVRSTKDNASWDLQQHTMNVDARTVDDGDTILVDAYSQGDTRDAQSTDLDITVPEQTDVEVEAAQGSVYLDNLHGGMHIEASDSINAQNIHGDHAPIAFRAHNGSIDVDQVEGQVLFSTVQGHIEVDGAHLYGHSRLHTLDGKIVFDGDVDPEGLYSFTSQNGEIDLSLPSFASFYAHVFADHGSIDNAFNANPVGPGPWAQLNIATQMGNVEINENN